MHQAISADHLGEPAPHYTTAKELADAMHPGIIPNDVDFKNSFAIFKIEGALARFYLRAIEVKYKNLPEPEWVPNEELDINLEHVLPKNPGANWGDISAEEAKANRSRLGNLALLQRTKNNLRRKQFVRCQEANPQELRLPTHQINRQEERLGRQGN